MRVIKTFMALFITLLLTGAISTINSKETFTLNTNQTGLNTVSHWLQHHNPLLQSRTQRHEFQHYSQSLIAQAQGPIPHWKAWLLFDKMLRKVNDPHTLMFPITVNHKYLPLEFYWVKHGLVILPTKMTPHGITTGDEVLTLGGLSTNKLLKRMETVIPGTPNFVRSFGTRFLTTGYFLQWLHLINSQQTVPLTIETPAGRIKHWDISLISQSFSTFDQQQNRARTQFAITFRDPPHLQISAPNFSWEISRQHHYAVFWLYHCVDTPNYLSAVNDFFREIYRFHITHVILDLQDNGGGNSSVMWPWLEWMHTPSIIRNYGGGALTLGDNPYPPVHPISPAQQFHGRIFVLTSWTTFSSAVVVADILAINHLAVIGGQTASMDLGAPRNVVELNVLGIPMQTSTQNPWASLYHKHLTLPVTVSIPLTVYDVQHHIDPIARWINRMWGR